jgi:hypothetical protein
MTELNPKSHHHWRLMDQRCAEIGVFDLTLSIKKPNLIDENHLALTPDVQDVEHKPATQA